MNKGTLEETAQETTEFYKLYHGIKIEKQKARRWLMIANKTLHLVALIVFGLVVIVALIIANAGRGASQ